MTLRFDVAARLADGRGAVEHTQTYLQACTALGYQEFTDVLNVYQAESGLDLKTLDADCAALRAAAGMVEEAASAQRAQLAELAAGWRGSGADSAARFLQRHCDTAAQVAERVRTAADSCAALRDNLWQAVDNKVATTIAIDERHAAERPAWLAAAHTVAGGERSTAEGLIRRQVMPYVDNDIRNDWLSAMHSTTASIGASYDTAIHALTSAPDATFEIPGDLGPSWQPAFVEPTHALPTFQATPDSAMPAATVPAAAPPASSSITPEPPQPDTTPESEPPLSDMNGLSTGAGGLGGLGGVAGGVGGVIGSIVDGIGSLIGSLAGGLGGTSGEPLLDDNIDDTDDPLDVDDKDEDDKDDKDDKDDEESVVADEPVDAGEPVDQLTENPPAAAEVAGEPAAPQPVDPPEDEQAQPATAKPDGATPCEIAEDQLPQAGQ